MQRPLLQLIALSLAVSVTLDHHPPEFRRYRFSRCFPNIAVNATNEVRRLAYIRHVAATISLAGSPWMGGTVEVSPGMADRLRVRGWHEEGQRIVRWDRVGDSNGR